MKATRPRLRTAAKPAWTRLRKRSFDVVLLDVWLPGMDGLETLQKIHDVENAPEVIMISGHGTIETAVRATKLGAYDFLEKPLSIDKTLILIKHAIDARQMKQENRELKKQLTPRSVIEGESVPMKALRQQIQLMAPTNGRVLIYGESGTGKELVAHAIHAQSLRKNEMFVELNCAAIPEDLIESELFGHRKGSFPAATTDKEGKFHRAHGGTLFLDEIGDMSLKTQSKVLRTLDEQRFTPVGSDEPVTVDARAHRVHQQGPRRRNFPRQLSRRLVLPSQRHSLLGSAVARTPGGHSAAGAPLSEGVFRHLRPPAARTHRRRDRDPDAIFLAGQRARVAQRDRAHRHHEPHHYPLRPQAPAAAGPSRWHAPLHRREFSTLHQARAAYERDYILKKLDDNHGNVSRTAEVLGLERSHLYRKMKTLGIAVKE